MSKEYFCKCLRARTKLDYDAVVAITGDEGSGKTTCAIGLGAEIDKDFSLQESMIYTTDIKEIEEKVRNKKIDILIVDEAIKILYKMNFQTKSQKYLNQLYTLCRKENKITILCIPRFRDMNEYFRNHRVKFWIHIVERGVAVVFVRDWSPFAKDPWWMDENQKIIDAEARSKKVVELDIKMKMKILSKSRNFLTVIQFADLTPEAQKEYKALGEAKKYEGLIKKSNDDDEKLGVREHKYREQLRKILFKRWLSLRSYKAVGDETEINKDEVRNLIMDLVTTDEKLQITPKLLISNKANNQKKSSFLSKLHQEQKVEHSQEEKNEPQSI